MRKRIERFFEVITIKWTAIVTGISWGIVFIDAINKSISSVENESIKFGLNIVKDIYMIVDNIIPFQYRNILMISMSGILSIVLIIKIKKERFDNQEELEEAITIEDNNKEKYQILAHVTMGNTQFITDQESSESIDMCINELNLSEDMKAIREYNDINYVVNKQDSYIKNFEDNLISGITCGYMGLAHTPLILRAGYKLGDGSKIKIFHKKRDSEYYAELSDEENNISIGIDRKEIKKKSDELILGIASTFDISNEDLEILQYKNKNLMIFKTESLGFDVITSKKQVENYVRYIMKVVRDFIKENNINKVHMVIASSVAFTFALGQAISENHDPEIIIYHYDRKHPKKYPWGIQLSKDSRECIIEN